MITIQEIESIFKTDTGRIRNLAFTHGAVGKIANDIRQRKLPDGIEFPLVGHRNTRRSHFPILPRGNVAFELFAQSIVIAFEQERVRSQKC